MKAKTTTIISSATLIALSIFLVISCKKSVKEQVSTDATFPYARVSNVKQVKLDAATLNKIKARFGKIKRLKASHVQTNGVKTNDENGFESPYIGLDEPTTVSYEGTDVQALMYNQGNGLTFVCFQQNGLLGDMSAFIKTDYLTSTATRTYYYDMDYQLVGQFDYDNEVFSNIYSYNPTPINATNGWFSRWTSCLTTSMNDMVYKRPVVGVACVIFGPSCGIGMLAGCAASATFD